MVRVLEGTVTADNYRQEEPLWKKWDYLAQKAGKHSTVFLPDTKQQYKGEWLDNKKHGKGTLTYKNGDRYQGDWQNDQRHGLGTLWIFDHGKYRLKYNGYWMYDAPHGEGTSIDENGNLYEGEYKDGKQDGRGKMAYRTESGDFGDEYEGDWKEGKRWGRGTLRKENGDIFEGCWENDMKHGKGTFYYIERQKRYDGYWENDVPRFGSLSALLQQLKEHEKQAQQLPFLELYRPELVLENALEEIQNA